MKLSSIRLITDDVARLVGFYERVTGTRAVWQAPAFAELRLDGATLAIASTATVPVFAPGAVTPAANRSVLVELLVDDVDAVYDDLRATLDDVVTTPTTMPWGNRSLVVRDPDGNLVNVFAPVTAEAAARTR